uniref:Uncharacterized protein n=1 Tax=Colobus angolensis palliatus TaxID=336983 RepID=A0A2K5JM81_COLAP
MESSCWDKVSPAQRSPQHGQDWRSWRWVVWPKVTQHWMRFQGQGPRCPELWTTQAHSHCSRGRQHLCLCLPCLPRLHGTPHIRDTILSETLSGSLVSDRRIKSVAGLRWLQLRKEATPTASRTTLSSSLAPRGRGGCALMDPSSDLFD